MMIATASPLTVSTMPWQIDPAHTSVQFAVRHLMIATVKGTFSGVTGTVGYDPTRRGLVDIDVTIPTGTIDTHDEKREAHLRSADFFDVEQHPAMSFKGKRLEGDTQSRFRLFGDLTIRDVTREVVLDVTSEGTGKDPWGNERMGFSATTKVNRLDFGLKWNMALEAGGVLVGDEVKITLDVEIVRPLG